MIPNEMQYEVTLIPCGTAAGRSVIDLRQYLCVAKSAFYEAQEGAYIFAYSVPTDFAICSYRLHNLFPQIT